MRATICLACLILIGCGSASQDAPTTSGYPTSVDHSYLFSKIWTATNGTTLDLTAGGDSGIAYGALATLKYTSGAKCDCGMNFMYGGLTDPPGEGAFETFSCSYTSGGSGDPGCAALVVNGTYTLLGTLVYCPTTGPCTTYH